MNKFALIVAGGLGHRFKGNIPKQFMLLNNLPILMHTLNTFIKFDNEINIILVLPKDQTIRWNELCKKYEFKIKHKVVIGGKTRFESVKCGLKEIKTKGLVAIHDGVRPLVSNDTINNCFKTAKTLGNAIPVIKSVDSIREIGFTECFPLKRENLRLVQTPQVFTIDSLKKAYKQKYTSSFTDDASVIESMGEKINMVEGNKENIKITTKTDLIIAQALI